mgnify:FL=1
MLFALLAKVDDEGKVEALLEALKNEQICTELKSESGMYMDTDGYGAVRF